MTGTPSSRQGSWSPGTSRLVSFESGDVVETDEYQPVIRRPVGGQDRTDVPVLTLGGQVEPLLIVLTRLRDHGPGSRNSLGYRPALLHPVDQLDELLHG